jgi:hypothetical protein
MSESIRIAPRVLAGGSIKGSPNRILPMAVAVFAVLSLSIGTLMGAALPAAPEVATVHSFAPVTVSLRTMSVYHPKYIGRKMANGDPYNPNALTVASNDWRLGTELTIVHAGRSVEVTVTDRMAKRFSGKRVDASQAVWDLLTSSAKPGLRRVEVQR